MTTPAFIRARFASPLGLHLVLDGRALVASTIRASGPTDDAAAGAHFPGDPSAGRGPCRH